MQVRVTQTLVRVVEIDVPDEIVHDSQKLRDFWCAHPKVGTDDINELDWVSTDFEEASTGRELGSI